MIFHLKNQLQRLVAQRHRRKLKEQFTELHPIDRQFALAALRFWNQHPRRWWYVGPSPHIHIVGE